MKPRLLVHEGSAPGPHACDDPSLTCERLQARYPKVPGLRAVKATASEDLWYVRDKLGGVIARGRTELEALHHARDALRARQPLPRGKIS